MIYRINRHWLQWEELLPTIKHWSCTSFLPDVGIFSNAKLALAANPYVDDSTKPLLRSNKNRKHSAGNKSIIQQFSFICKNANNLRHELVFLKS